MEQLPRCRLLRQALAVRPNRPAFEPAERWLSVLEAPGTAGSGAGCRRHHGQQLALDKAKIADALFGAEQTTRQRPLSVDQADMGGAGEDRPVLRGLLVEVELALALGNKATWRWVMRRIAFATVGSSTLASRLSSTRLCALVIITSPKSWCRRSSGSSTALTWRMIASVWRSTHVSRTADTSSSRLEKCQ